MKEFKIVLIILIFVCSTFVCNNHKLFHNPRVVVAENPVNEIHSFLLEMAMVESSNRYSVVSDNGMLGKYQFYWPTAKYHLYRLGYPDMTPNKFLASHALQDTVMVWNMMHNNKILRNYISKYENTVVDGILINRASILAGAQFGPGAVIEFFNREGKYDITDSNGVHVKTFMKRFSKYNLPNDFGYAYE